VSWSPDGTALATVRDNGAVQLWDVGTGRPTSTRASRRLLKETARAGKTREVAYSPDGSRLATTHDDGTVRIWRASNGRLMTSLSSSHGKVTAAWSPDGALLAVGGEDIAVRLWNPATRRLQATLVGHTTPVQRIAWSPDGDQLASLSLDEDGTAEVRIWRTATGESLGGFPGRSPYVLGLAWSPDGRLLATAGLHGQLTVYAPDADPLLVGLDTPRCLDWTDLGIAVGVGHGLTLISLVP
jgi:WD40 repeat protein